MRRVACYGARSQLTAGETATAVSDALLGLVSKWLEAKGLSSVKEGVSAGVLSDGRTAELSASHSVCASGTAWDISLRETTDSGLFQTRIVFGVRDDSVHFFIESRAGVDGYRLAPIQFDARRPMVLRDFLKSREWTVGTTPVVAVPIACKGDDAGLKFLQVVNHQDRNLPVVAVSVAAGDTWAANLADRLSDDLCGLALTTKLDEAASWAVSREAGSEWSCYNGAVRIFWPRMGHATGRIERSLWVRSKILGSASDPKDAAERFRDQIRRQILELSTYTIDEPQALRSVREDSIRERFEAVKRTADTSKTDSALLDDLFSRCHELEEKLSDERAAKQALMAKVDNLTVAWRHSRVSEPEADIPPESVTPISTVQQAVDRASIDFKDDLVFGNDVPRSVEDLAEDAGPPDKLYEYFRVLAEMARLRRGPGLKKNVLDWLLNDRHVQASQESKTTLGNTAEMRRRTWHDGRTKRQFNYHLKPVQGTSPDRCVRIYFAYDDETTKAVVGYVGRHL